MKTLYEGSPMIWKTRRQTSLQAKKAALWAQTSFKKLLQKIHHFLEESRFQTIASRPLAFLVEKGRNVHHCTHLGR